MVNISIHRSGIRSSATSTAHCRVFQNAKEHWTRPQQMEGRIFPSPVDIEERWCAWAFVQWRPTTMQYICQNTWRDSLSNNSSSNDNSSNYNLSNDNLSNDSSTKRQFIETTVHRTDSLSNDNSTNRQFIEPTVYRTDSLSNQQFIESTVYRTTVYLTDSLSKREFIEFFKTECQHFTWTHARRSSNFIIPIKTVSNVPMQRVYRILLNPITVF